MTQEKRILNYGHGFRILLKLICFFARMTFIIIPDG